MLRSLVAGGNFICVLLAITGALAAVAVAVAVASCVYGYMYHAAMNRDFIKAKIYRRLL